MPSGANRRRFFPAHASISPALPWSRRASTTLLLRVQRRARRRKWKRTKEPQGRAETCWREVETVANVPRHGSPRKLFPVQLLVARQRLAIARRRDALEIAPGEFRAFAE